MALIYNRDDVIYYALSTDISASKISGASVKGAWVYLTDTNSWYVVKDDLTLSPLAMPSGSSIVSFASPTVDTSFTGQIFISSSTVAYSGSNLSVTNSSGFLIKSVPANTGVVWIVYHGGYFSGSQAASYPLSANEQLIYSGSSLSNLDYGILGASSGCVAWVKV